MIQCHEQKPVILLVEDEPFVRMVVGDFLSEHGVEVLEAADALSALDVLENRLDVRLLFTDIRMPGLLDGSDLAQKVAERWPTLRLLLTTGKDMPPLSRIPTGCSFVPKPYDLDRLLDRITDLLER